MKVLEPLSGFILEIHGPLPHLTPTVIDMTIKGWC